MRFFVTGGTGFIGKHLVHRLAHDGHEVVCLVRSAKKAAAIQMPGVHFVNGEIGDRQAVMDGMRGCDRVVHLANVYSMWLRNASEFQRVNVDGTRLVMECALESGIERVVYVSTVAVFGRPEEIPFNEDSQPGDGFFSQYAATKAEGNRIAWELHREKGLPLVVLYPGIVLGEGDDKASGQYIQDVIFQRVPSTIFHDSKAIYVYVEDVVDAIIAACQLPNVVGKRYLVGGHCLDGKQYVKLMSEISGCRLPILHLPDWFVLMASHLFTAISNLTGWKPIWGLSVDAGRTLKAGFVFDGSRAVKELGIHYTPIRQALTEAISSYRSKK